MRERRPLAEKFWEKVNISGPNDCWNWFAKAKTDFGYGRMTHGRGVHLKSHRISWFLTNGEIPAGMCVCHKCDNPACCNPNHLFLGTKKDNSQDMKAKNRMVLPPVKAGEKHHNSKIPSSDLPYVRSGVLTRRQFAKKYGVSYQTIYRIQKNQSRANENI